MISKANWAFAAGFFEGDGSTGISRTAYRGNRSGYRYEAWFAIANTDLRLLRWLKRRFGGHISEYRTRNANPVRFKSTHRVFAWQLRAGQLAEFLKGILPFLVGKRRIVQHVLRFRQRIDRKPGKRNWQYRAWQRSKQVNHLPQGKRKVRH